MRHIRLHRVQSDPVTLHFSPGYAKRAQTLGKLVSEAHFFLAEWLDVEARTTVSLLRRESWRRVRRAPYGYPHSTPDKSTLFAPAHYPQRLISRQRVLFEQATPVLQQKICEDRHKIDDAIKQFFDLVAIHELGHLFIHHLQLQLGTRWLTELIANLFATAFFVEVRPDLALTWLAWSELQVELDVSYRSLEAYETGYTSLDFANSNYYQGRFNQKALLLWQTHGRELAPILIHSFSSQPDTIMTRFSQVVPTFEW